MAERSFAREVETLRLGDGEVFHGEGILAVTKALLQSGVPLLRALDILEKQNSNQALAFALREVRAKIHAAEQVQRELTGA